MRDLLHILAESEPSIIGKIVPFIFVLIWVISGIVGTLSKKKRQEEVRRRAEEAMRNPPVDFDTDLNLPPRPEPGRREPMRSEPVLERESPPPLPSSRHPMERHRSAERDPVREMPRKPVPRVPTGTRQQETADRRKRIADQVKRVERDRVAAVKRLEALTASAPPVPVVAERVEVQAMPARSVKSQGVTAATVSRWLTPQTLRTQFILTEVFQPPIALRPDRDVG